jgi:hypothetical protein
MNSTATKPTIRTSDVAQLRALQQGHGYTITRTETGWTVRNNQSGAKYAVTVDGCCNCPHFAQRLEGSGETCKHFAMADLAERLDLVELRVVAAEPQPAGICDHCGREGVNPHCVKCGGFDMTAARTQRTGGQRWDRLTPAQRRAVDFPEF